MSDSSCGSNPIPRWRGFNLTEFQSISSRGDFRCDDLALIRDWGFDFVRVPLNYRLWADPAEPGGAREGWLEKIDRVVEQGIDHGLHVCLNFHRAPGYTVSQEGPEPRNLWTDEEAEAQFIFHWELFARRYRGIPGTRLSFNLINEPKDVSAEMSREDHNRVISRVVSGIRAIDSDRAIVIDGLRWGREPLEELADLGVWQSCRGYDPIVVSHYGTKRFEGTGRPPPVWPGISFKGRQWDRSTLSALYEPWVRLIEKGVGVHCGEMGCRAGTPHSVALAWLRDLLTVLREHGIGWALWNLRGPFGVLDSGRDDVDYEVTSFGRLDRDMLDLLQQY